MICASLLLLNKSDLVRPEQLEKIKQKVAKIVGKEKQMVNCNYGQVEPGVLFVKRFQSISIGDEHSVGTHHHHHSTLQAIKLEDLPQLQQRTFEKWLNQLPSGILRGKGFVEIDNSHQLYGFQYASKKATFTRVPSSINKKPVIILIGMGLDDEQINAHCKQLLSLK